MSTMSKRLVAVAVSTALMAPLAVHATNGMNLEGYGPIATGMGGASMAYDNGTAAVMNNPATLGLMDEGSRLDLAVGNLRPSVTTSMTGASWESASDSFFMPAIGWASKNGSLTYGVAMMAQGGMGTEYSNPTMGAPGGAGSAQYISTSNYADAAALGAALTADPTALFTLSPVDTVTALGFAPPGGFSAIDLSDFMDDGTVNGSTSSVGEAAAAVVPLTERSEVSVGRVLVPFVFNLSDSINVGASIDFVWAGMDLQMAMPGSNMGAMIQSGDINGDMVQAMQALYLMTPNATTGNPEVNAANPFYSTGADATAGTADDLYAGLVGLNYGYFDFTDNSPYTGKAMGTGLAGKLGVTFKLSPALTIGATYHSKTSLGDLEADGAKVSMNVLWYTNDTNQDGTPDTSGVMDMAMDLTGKIKVVDFQWPATFAVGASFRATDKLMIVADYKHIAWSDVMKDFKMTFTADQSASNNLSGAAAGNPMDMRGKTMNATMAQNWEDQSVIQLGASYAVTEATTVRVGMNTSSSPVPDSTLNYLFPAITESHMTFGVGHQLSESSSIDFSLVSVSEASQTSGMTGLTSKMSQTNWQLMYSKKF